MADDLDQPAPAPYCAIKAAYTQAIKSRPSDCHTRRYRFGGLPVQMNITGAGLAASTGRTFVHLADEEDSAVAPVLTIDLWEDERPDDFLPRQEAERSWEMVFFGHLLSYGGGRWLEWRKPGSVTWYDRGAARMVGWRSSRTPISTEEFSKPLSMLFWTWYHDQGIQVVHSGLLATADGAALIGGIGGSGKSTTSIAGVLGGLGFAGDDHVGLQQLPDGSFVGHSLYNCVRLARDNIGRFPQLAPHVYDPDGLAEEKLLLFLADLYPESMRRKAPVTAVVLPRLSGAATTSFTPAKKAEALMRLAPSSVMMPLRSGAEGFNLLSDLVRRVPCYWLDLGLDVGEIPAAISKLLSESAVEAEAR